MLNQSELEDLGEAGIIADPVITILYLFQGVALAQNDPYPITTLSFIRSL